MTLVWVRECAEGPSSIIRDSHFTKGMMGALGGAVTLNIIVSAHGIYVSCSIYRQLLGTLKLDWLGGLLTFTTHGGSRSRNSQIELKNVT